MRVYKMVVTDLNRKVPFDMIVRTVVIPHPKAFYLLSDEEGNLLVRTNKRPLNMPELFVWWEEIDPDLEAEILGEISEREKSDGGSKLDENPIAFLPCSECGATVSVSNWGEVSDCIQCEKPGYQIGEEDE